MFKCKRRLKSNWGCMVILSAFIAQLLSDGISYGFGILYVDLMATFDGTSAQISSIGSLSFGAFCFIGPVAGALTNKLGSRFVTILGSLLEALGLFLSAFTPNLGFLYFSVGILIGAGSGMIYIAGFVYVSAYFDERRPLATSLASCGSSVGTFLFGFLYRVCIDYYGWRGALILFSGLMLNGVVCGTIFRPIPEECNLDPSDDDVFLESDRRQSTGKDNTAFENDAAQIVNIALTRTEQTQSMENTPRPGESTDNKSEIIASKELINSQTPDKSRIASKRVSISLNAVKEGTQGSNDDTQINLYEGVANETKPSEKSFEGNKTDQSISNLQRYSRQISREISRQYSLTKSRFKMSASTASSIRSRTLSVATVTLGTTNVKLFKDWRFVLYAISTFLFCFGYGIPFVLLPDMAEMNGFSPDEAAWIISEFGVAAIVGKIVFGFSSQFLTERDSHANAKLNSFGVMMSGLAIACSPWTHSYPVLLVVGAVFGVMSAAVNTLVTLVLIEMLGEDRLADAFGWLNFFGGVGYVSGPVVAGWLFDVTQAYIATFIATGVSLVLSGIVILPIILTSTGQSIKSEPTEPANPVRTERRQSVCPSIRPSFSY